MKNIFIAHTPYHVLLSNALALGEGNLVDNHLFIISDFSDAELLAQSLKSWNRSPFTQITLLNGVYGEASMVHRILTVRKNITQISRFISKCKVDRVYVFNDSRAEGQAALHFSTKNNNRTLGTYVEDGWAAYSSFTKKLSFLKVILGKLLYGSWWENVRVYGTSRSIKEVKVIYPQFVRPEIRSRKVSQIPKQDMLNLKNYDFLHKYLESFGLNFRDLSQIEGILLVSHSEILRQYSTYMAVLQDLVVLAENSGLRIAIKYHPRESEQMKEFPVTNGKKMVLLPQSLPIEVVYILTGANIKVVIGDVSSSLLTAKWLLQNATVISMASVMDFQHPVLYEIFNKLGIIIADSTERVEQVLRITAK